MKWQLLGERRAVALLIIGFFTTIFVLGGLALGGDWLTFFMAMAVVYGIGFFALAAEWFWARWYVMGIGMSGVSMALFGFASLGWNEVLAVWGGMHLLIYLPVLGEKMAGRYENKPGWRERYALDDYGVARLKRSVYGAATALPTMVMFTLAPRQDQGMMALGLLAVVSLGLAGLLRLKVWGVALLGVGAIGLTLLASLGAAATNTVFVGEITTNMVLHWTAVVTAVSLIVSVSPFIVPAYTYLREDR